MGEEPGDSGGTDRVLEKRRGYIPDYQQRKRAGLWIASTRVEKYNDWAVSGRCKHQGMSWSPQGVLALAALEAARRNGELVVWREERRFRSKRCQTRLSRPPDCGAGAPTGERQAKFSPGEIAIVSGGLVTANAPEDPE